MATNTERLDSLEKQVAALNVQEKVFARDLTHFESAMKQWRDEVAKLRAEHEALRAALTESEKRSAVLEAAVKELKAGSDKWGQRWWTLAAGIVLILVSGGAGYLIKSLLTR